MITAAEEEFIATHAYVPEHLPGYVTSISRAEPHLFGAHVCYGGQRSLIFIGYPLGSPFDAKAMMETFEAARLRFRPGRIAFIGPAIPTNWETHRERRRDQYFRLDLAALTIHAKVRNMIRRASRELSLEIARQIGEEHACLISEFMESHDLPPDARTLYSRIPDYVSAAATVRVFNARDSTGTLVAFDLADFGARSYAFYQFNFLARRSYVPGAADFLLHELARAARQEGKSFLNLGLGIHPGVVNFKRKWGAAPFLPYECCRYRSGPPGLLDAILHMR